MFTAVAIARLVEMGRLGWTDPVGRHLQGWLPEELARTITVEQLLTHTSGLGDYLDRVADDPGIRNARTLTAYRNLVREARVAGGHEDGLRYSNLGYVVLGALIEAVSGRDYFDFVRDEIYAKAGMTRTGSFAADEIVENRAIGYLNPDEAERAGLGRGWRTNAALQGVRGTSAGGGLATAGDLLRFARALVHGKLVARETLETLLAPRVRFPLGGSYGYGFVIHATPGGRRVFGHGGGFPGVNGELKVYGDGEYTLVVLSNLSGGAGEIAGAWDGIAARLK
jgi:CubicO group peptidase (beta-lactamase class C family)